MTELDLTDRNLNNYQRVIRQFDRIPSGSSLTVLTDRNPEWLVEMVRELRPTDLADCQFTDDDEHDYAVTFRKTRYPGQ